ncbi:MAG TPA: V-type ATP synthase subunit E family protein [Anaerolineales bacterium]|nr:V-type ATP synthase subunit E family protein [Anaerolineales bacterium]
MKSESKDIEMLERAILMEAREEAGQMQAEAKEKADAIHRRAREQAESERRTILDRANQDAERLRSQAMATAQLKARSTQLKHREKLLDSVFIEVKKQLEVVKKRPDYDAIAALLLREALTELRVHKAEIRADESTQKALKKGALDEVAKELKGEFTLAGVLEEGNGVVVDAADGKIHYDNTFETRLNRLQNTLRSSVYKVLMGESA